MTTFKEADPAVAQLDARDVDLLRTYRALNAVRLWTAVAVWLAVLGSVIFNGGRLSTSAWFLGVAACCLVGYAKARHLAAELVARIDSIRSFDSLPPYRVGMRITLCPNPSGISLRNLVGEVVSLEDDARGRARIVSEPIDGAAEVSHAGRTANVRHGDVVLFQHISSERHRRPFIVEKV